MIDQIKDQGGYILALLLFSIFFLLSSNAFAYLGFSPLLAITVLFASLIGSQINIPLKVLNSWSTIDDSYRTYGDTSYNVYQHEGTTILSINVGGALIPMIISLVLWFRFPSAIIPSIISVIIAAVIINRKAQVKSNIGIQLPNYVVPSITVFLVIVMIPFVNPELSPIIAYSCGVFGSLIGADLTKLNDIAVMGPPRANIGGAGTFDGIFLSGIVSILFLSILGII